MPPEDTQVPAENAQAAEDNSQGATPTPQPTTSDGNQQPATENQPSSAEETGSETQAVEQPPESKPEPKRAEKRIREFASKNRELEAENQRLRQFATAPQLQPDESGFVSPEQLSDFVAQQAQAVSNQTVSQAVALERAKNNFDADLAIVPQQFPELNEESGSYIPELEEAITEEYQDKAYKVVGIDQATGNPQYTLDPSVRLADIASKHVKVARAAAERATASVRKAEAENADQAALTPGAGAPVDKPLAEMSIEELTAKVGYHNG